jgi:two-component system sensor histidine kinase/response regulator
MKRIKQALLPSLLFLVAGAAGVAANVAPKAELIEEFKSGNAAHIETILQKRRDVGELMATIVNTPTISRLDDLRLACLAQYVPSTWRSDRLQAGLYVLAVGMLLCIGFVMVRLRTTILALNRAKDMLEQRVIERTNDLTKANIELAREIHENLRAKAELSTAKVAAESANRAKSEFLANISHEIRTPMNGILGMTELVLDTNLTREQREALELVKLSTDSLLTVVNDILDYPKIEAGNLELDPISFKLPDLLGDVLKILALRAHAKGLELVGDIAADVPEWVVGDPGRLRQVIVNLIGNAIKFTERGEIVLRAMVKSRTCTESVLEFSVVDTGTGIAAERLGVIFAPFSEADGSTTRRFGGTGLGLTISARLVALMGGQITVESEVGHGSTFRFEARFGEAPAALEPAVKDSADLRGLTALIVDDNETNRRILSGLLRIWGMRPKTVDGGPAAIAELCRVRAAGETYPLMLVDQMMPEMDGFTLLEELQNSPGLAPQTMMMLSSADRQENAARCRRLRIAAYLVNPVKADELQIAIIAALRRSPREKHPLTVWQPAPADQSQVAATQRPLRILVAEDNAVNQRVALRILQKAGHFAEIVGNGKEAIEALARDSFDVVLMDVQMPKMDGIAATRAIREQEIRSGQHIPIVAMTAHAMKGDRERCLQAGMDDYVAKPIQRAELSRALDSIPRRTDRTITRHPGGNGESNWVFGRQASPERRDGDEQVLSETICRFLADAPTRLDEIRDAVYQHDSERLVRAVQTIKSSVACLRAPPFAAAVLRLEEIGRSSDFSDASEALAALEQETQHLVEALSGGVLVAHA